MRHWYAYHSDRVMGYTYASVGASQMYLTKCHPLALSDVIWVVEGDLKKPAGFRLTDCFRYTLAEYPPFPAGYEGFKLKILGHSSLLTHEIPLDKAELWFSTLHSMYITKQKFFHSLSLELSMVTGLCHASNIKF